jgi:hypothetical protein
MWKSLGFAGERLKHQVDRGLELRIVAGQQIGPMARQRAAD